MRRLLYFLLFLLFSKASSQNLETRVTISFSQASLEEALAQLESISTYRFYYAEEWIQDIPISGTYENVEIEIVLNEIFATSELNFYVVEDSIVLLKNSVVYDKLPEGFFNKERDTFRVTGDIEEPTPLNVFLDSRKKTNGHNLKTYRIGKTSADSKKQSFMLSGIVKNKNTGEVIPNLSILVKGSQKGTVTDSSGFYSIELPFGNSLLEARSLGIENTFINVVIYSDGVLNLNLSDDVEQLEEVTITANVDKNVKETITSATELDVEETKNVPLVLGERDVLKVATNLPGISTAGEGATGFNVRGGKVDQNLILFDDAVLYNPQHFFGIFSALNPFALGDVKIYKGAIPAEFGGRLSSVFDIKTKKVNTNDFSGEASIGPVTGNLVLEIPVVKEKAGLMLGGRAAYANWILDALNDASLNDSEASFYDITATYNHSFGEKNKIRATAYASRDDFSITSDSLFIYENKLLSLRWDHKINERRDFSLMLGNSSYGFGIDFDGSSTDDFKLNYTINETFLKLKFNHSFNSNIRFKYGLSSKLYDIEPGILRPFNDASLVERVEIPREKGLESAIFLSSDLDINKRIAFNTGLRFSIFNFLGPTAQRTYAPNAPLNNESVLDTLRFDNNEIVETYTGPEVRVSGRYLFTNSFSLKASYNSTYQFIHRLSNNTTASPIDAWKLSDGNIAPQRSNQFSLGLYKNLMDNEFEVSMEGFYKTSTNILDFKTGSQILLNEFIETEVLQGQGKAYGVEFLIEKSLGRLNGWLGYTYSRSFIKLDSEFEEEKVNNGAFFPSNFDKPHDFSFVGNYKFNKRFSISANFVYQTGRPVTFPIGNFNFGGSDFVVFSDRNQFRIPDFYRLDLGFNIEGNHKKKKLGHSFLSISIYNVLGRNNPFSVFFVTENGEIQALQSSIFTIPVPSITYNIKF